MSARAPLWSTSCAAMNPPLAEVGDHAGAAGARGGGSQGRGRGGAANARAPAARPHLPRSLGRRRQGPPVRPTSRAQHRRAIGREADRTPPQAEGVKGSRDVVAEAETLAGATSSASKPAREAYAAATPSQSSELEPLEPRCRGRRPAPVGGASLLRRPGFERPPSGRRSAPPGPPIRRRPPPRDRNARTGPIPAARA